LPNSIITTKDHEQQESRRKNVVENPDLWPEPTQGVCPGEDCASATIVSAAMITAQSVFGFMTNLAD
jgi:hypothetical protein